jgi:hypothetical protein
MVTGMSSSASTPLRQLIENRLAELTAETESLFAEARERTRRDVSDQLNQAARRMRQSSTVDELAATLADAVSAFSSGAILFRVQDDLAKSEKLEVPLASAAALRGAIETRDPVIAAATPAEVSPELIEFLGHSGDDRVSVFPVVVREGAPALLYVWGAVQGAAVELLTQVAAAVWTVLTVPPPPPAPELVTIAPAAPREQPAWDQLSAQEQQLHLRAQRFARVQIAEMRLFETDAVHSGRSGSDLYGALRKSIDSSREKFRQTFFVDCPSMVDYLHLELLRTLAHDNPELLGKNYPGPMV